MRGKIGLLCASLLLLVAVMASPVSSRYVENVSLNEVRIQLDLPETGLSEGQRLTLAQAVMEALYSCSYQNTLLIDWMNNGSRNNVNSNDGNGPGATVDAWVRSRTGITGTYYWQLRQVKKDHYVYITCVSPLYAGEISPLYRYSADMTCVEGTGTFALTWNGYYYFTGNWN